MDKDVAFIAEQISNREELKKMFLLAVNSRKEIIEHVTKFLEMMKEDKEG